ncbi:MAG TPA: UDP-N-acetylmuramate dehydrogenase [Verrucomicrobiae bacterium]|nr:UDP-N-acetylmuramate dehydrogenase [Verrucomicrobiae bacterium]
MNIQENVPLSAHSTMQLGGPARYLADIASRNDLTEALTWAAQKQLPVMMIGTGSNIIWGDKGFAGLVLVNKITGFEIQDIDASSKYLIVGGGENWDSVVARAVEQGLSGIELLSRIPGTAGAAPVQNIGAYGAQLSDVLVTLETYDLQANKFVTLMAADCAFGYRTSRFKSADKGRFFITGITIRLEHGMAQPPYYRDIQAYIEQNKVTDITLASLRDIVSHIREKKLPDPRIIPNTGSFFQNPIISKEAYQTIVENHPQIEKAPMGWSQPPRWFLDNEQVKLSAGWLVEQAGFKAYEDKETGMATWPYQNLVLTNKGAHSTADLLKFKQKIIDAVQAKFGVALVQEPELIGA